MMINQTALSVAAANAAAQTALNSNTRRLTYLNTLRNGLGTTPDVKAAADATARLAGENATSQAQTNQLLALLLLQKATAATTVAQEQQVWRCSADALVARAQAAAAAAASGNVTLVSTSGAAVNCGPSFSSAVANTAVDPLAPAAASSGTGTVTSGSGTASPCQATVRRSRQC